MHGYIIVYSITDRRSYQKAADVLASIRYQHSGCPRPIILVANKSDLERSRMIGKEGEMKSSVVIHNRIAPCGLRGCKDRPTPFPDRR